MAYNQTDAWAYGMLELVTTFMVRIGNNKEGLVKLKEFIPQFCLGHRAEEAALMQFIVACEHLDD